MFGTRNFEVGTKLWFLLLVTFAVLGSSLSGRVQAQSASDIVYVESISWNSDGTRFAVGYYTGNVGVYDAVSLELRDVYEVGQLSVEIVWSSADPTLLAIKGTEVSYSVLRVFNTGTSEVVFEAQSAEDYRYRSVMWSPDGTQIGTTVVPFVGNLIPSYIQVWNLADQTEEAAYLHSGMSYTAAAWSPVDDRIVISGAASFVPIRLTMSQIGQDEPLFDVADAHEGTISDIAWSPDGISIVTASFAGDFDGLIRIWDTQSGQLIRVSEDSDYWTVAASWSPDGDYVAVTNRASVDILDPLSGSRVETYATNLDVQQSVAYSPFGGRLAFGGILNPASPAIDVPGTAIADGAVWIVVPLPSLERLEAVGTLCAAAASDATVFDTLETDDLLAYINQVEALADDGQIAPGCAADLIAVAEAILEAR